MKFGVGFGNFQPSITNHALLVNGEVVVPVLADMPGFIPGINLRNYYVIVSVGEGDELIRSVTIDQGVSGFDGDGLIFDHVAIRQACLNTDDSDGDGVANSVDNCLTIPNSDQRDTNGDSFGNACDPDIGGPAGLGIDDRLVNFVDLLLVKNVFFSNPGSPTWNPDADFTGDDQVNFADLNRMKSFFLGAPGPSCAAAPP